MCALTVVENAAVLLDFFRRLFGSVRTTFVGQLDCHAQGLVAHAATRTEYSDFQHTCLSPSRDLPAERSRRGLATLTGLSRAMVASAVGRRLQVAYELIDPVDCCEETF